MIDKRKELCLVPITDIIFHEDSINCIIINEKHNIIITGSEDGYIYIRNLYDYELMVCINTQNKIIDIKLSNFDLLYVISYDIKIEDKFIISGYTLNGINFTLYTGLINNIEFTKNGSLIMGYYNTNKIHIVNPINIEKVSNVLLFISHLYIYKF